MRAFKPFNFLRGCTAVTVLVLCTLYVLMPEGALGQRTGQTPEQLRGVGVDQRLGSTIPTDQFFRTSEGEKVRLGDFFDGETPVMLTLNYHRCPQLCQIQLRKFAASVSQMSWTAGEKFEVLTVDINPEEGPEDARTAKKRYRAEFEQPEETFDGWHFLTGTEEAIRAVADSVGFRYKRLEGKEQQFAHPAAVIFLDGSGTVTRYFTTLDPAPGDLRTALVDATNGEIGTVADKVFLSCARFDPDSNSYSASAFKLMQYGSGLLVIVMGGVLFMFWRREKRRQEKSGREADEQDIDEVLEAALDERR